ncbi:acetolactate decarboxylase [Candidatus Latescibacterota bacterium]
MKTVPRAGDPASRQEQMHKRKGLTDMENDWMRIMKDTVIQVSILDALLARKFDGCLPCRELLKYGDLGIGTYDRMDGEMIVVDANLYQAKADGKVYTPDPDNRTPFATVCRFDPDQTWTLSESTNLEAMKKEIDEKVSNQNVHCAIRVEGYFSYMKTHSLQIQSKPFPPTVEVVKGCVQREMKDVSGMIVGFRSPPYVRGIGDPGYHLHFISDERTQGGHVLAFVMDRGTCAVDICSNHLVILPEDGAALADIDLSKDLVKEFHDALSGG